MKLYDVPRNSRVVIVEGDVKYYLNFHHVDGMYSYCVDDDGNVVHPAAWTEVELVEETKQ